MSSTPTIDFCPNSGELLLLKVDWANPNQTWEVRCLKIYDPKHHSLETKIEKLYTALRYFHKLHEKLDIELKKIDADIEKLSKGPFNSLLVENQRAKSMLEDRRLKTSSSMELILSVLSISEDEVDQACRLKMASFKPRQRGAWSYLKKQAGSLVAQNPEQEERKYFCEGPEEESKRSCKYFEPTLYNLSTTLGGWWTKSRGRAGSCRSKRKMDLIRATYDESFKSLLETQSRFVFLEKKKIQYSLTVEEEREKALLSHSLKPLAVQFGDKIGPIREIAEATAALGIVNQEIANCSDSRRGSLCDQTKTSSLILKKTELEKKISKLTQSSLSKLLTSKITWVVILLACAFLVFYLGVGGVVGSAIYSAGSSVVSGVSSAGNYVIGSLGWLISFTNDMWEKLKSSFCVKSMETLAVQGAITAIGTQTRFASWVIRLMGGLTMFQSICTLVNYAKTNWGTTENSSSTSSTGNSSSTSSTESSSSTSLTGNSSSTSSTKNPLSPSSTETSSSTFPTLVDDHPLGDAQIPRETQQQDTSQSKTTDQIPRQQPRRRPRLTQRKKTPNVPMDK